MLNFLRPDYNLVHFVSEIKDLARRSRIIRKHLTLYNLPARSLALQKLPR